MSAESIKLTDPHDHPEPHTMKWTQAEMDYINNRVETAVLQAIEQAQKQERTGSCPLEDCDGGPETHGCWAHNCEWKAQKQEPVAYWIPKAEQFCIASPTGRPFAKAWEPLYTSPPQHQPEPVACVACDQAHAVLDSDESKIIRDAKDGYPEGRKPKVLTLAERVSALCTYAADWKRWCLEKEATPPQRQSIDNESDNG